MMAEGNRKDLRLRYEQPRDKIPIIFNYEGSDSVLEISNRYSIAQIESNWDFFKNNLHIWLAS